MFRYGASLLSGLIVGRIIYELMWQGLFQRGAYADALPMAVCMAVGGLLGYYAASMLLEKSRRVFRDDSLPGWRVMVRAGSFCITGWNPHLIFSIMWTVRFPAVWQFLHGFHDSFPDTGE